MSSILTPIPKRSVAYEGRIMKMSEGVTIRKEVGTPTAVEKLQGLSPLKRAFRLKTMLEALRGKRLDPDHANVRRIVGRAQ